VLLLLHYPSPCIPERFLLIPFLNNVFPLPTRSFFFRYRFFYSFRSLDKFIVIFQFLVNKFCVSFSAIQVLDVAFILLLHFFVHLRSSTVTMSLLLECLTKRCQQFPSSILLSSCFSIFHIHFFFSSSVFRLSTSFSFFMFPFFSIFFYHCITLAIHS